MKKMLFILSLTSALSFAQAGDHTEEGYLCSYTAYISDANKSNSSGKRLDKKVNLAAVAAILQQDRADVHRFETLDHGDTKDCYFDTPEKRQRMFKMLQKGSISKGAIKSIVRGKPVVHVDVYSSHIEVSVD